jgi:hypothetical protein
MLLRQPVSIQPVNYSRKWNREVVLQSAWPPSRKIAAIFRWPRLPPRRRASSGLGLGYIDMLNVTLLSVASFETVQQGEKSAHGLWISLSSCYR